MGLVARALELEGIATTLTSWNAGVTRLTRPPRATFTRLARGATLGQPGDPAQQQRVLNATLALLAQPAPQEPVQLNEQLEPTPMPVTDTIAELTRASDGLLVPSETDAPFTPVRWGDQPVTEATLRSQVGVAADARVLPWSLDDFLTPLMQNQAWHTERQKQAVQGFTSLHATLTRLLHDIQVWRVGEIEEHVIILGRDQQHDLIGLRTLLVRT